MAALLGPARQRQLTTAAGSRGGTRGGSWQQGRHTRAAAGRDARGRAAVPRAPPGRSCGAPARHGAARTPGGRGGGAAVSLAQTKTRRQVVPGERLRRVAAGGDDATTGGRHSAPLSPAAPPRGRTPRGRSPHAGSCPQLAWHCCPYFFELLFKTTEQAAVLSGQLPRSPSRKSESRWAAGD